MGRKYTVDELNKCSKQELMLMVLAIQEQMERMNGNLENLIEQIRVANQERFGRHTDKCQNWTDSFLFSMKLSIIPKMPENRSWKRCCARKSGVKSRKANGRLTLRISRKKCMTMMLQKNSSMRYSVKGTGVKCRRRNTSVSVMSLRHGQLDS